MKKIFMFMMLVCGSFMLSSCLEFDEPGDELEKNQKLYQYESYYKLTCSTVGFDASLGDEFKVVSVGLDASTSDAYTATAEGEKEVSIPADKVCTIYATAGPGRAATLMVNGMMVGSSYALLGEVNNKFTVVAMYYDLP